jgi:hypothetical protein
VDPRGQGLSDSPETNALADLEALCDLVESSYEYMLAYASRGMVHETGSDIRRTLGKLDSALIDLPGCLSRCAAILHPDAASQYEPFIDVLRRDALDARSAIALVTLQPSIGSQLVDNLNASTHLRALLTGLFLVDEVLKSRKRKA